MILSGIADEAGKDIATQIKAHKQLGWDHIELRFVNGKNVSGEVSDEKFDQVRKELEDNQMTVSCFASAIGNWSRHITDDFNNDLNDLKVSIGRMKALGVKYMRVMSWKGEGVPESQWRNEAVRRSKELSKIAEDAGIYLCHENCTGWGGLSADNMIEIKQAVDSPNFVLLYDIGNTIGHGYEPWQFFEKIRNNFEYLHVKDARKNPQGGHSNDFTYCGDGDAMVREILSKIILEDGYNGVISIEPHISSIVTMTEKKAGEEELFPSYIKYGKKLELILKKITN